MGISADSNPQTVALSLGSKNANIHLLVMCFGGTDAVLLSKQPKKGERPSVLHLPDANLAFNDDITTSSSLKQLADIIVSDEMKNSTIVISNTTLLWSGVSNEASQDQVTIITACRVQIADANILAWFEEHSVPYPRLNYDPLNTPSAPKSITLAIHSWKQFLSFASGPLVRRPDHQHTANQKPVIVVFLTRENRKARRLDKRRNRGDEKRSRIEEVWEATERFAVPARVVAGQRLPHKKLRKGKRQTVPVRGPKKKFLEDACMSFKALKRDEVKAESA